MAEYPEHEKLAAVREESQAIGEFLDGCGYVLCRIMYRAPHNGLGGLSAEPTHDDQHGHYQAVSQPIEGILAEWFGIDQAKLEDEKRAMLAEIHS